MEKYFTPLRLPINEVFNAIKDQQWVKRLKPIQYNPILLRVEEYYSYHDSKGHQTIHCRSFLKYLEELVCQGFLKEYILTPGTTSDARQPRAPSTTQVRHMITQYKVIE